LSFIQEWLQGGSIPPPETNFNLYIMDKNEMKKIIIEQQELIVLLRSKLAKLRGKYGETLKEYEL
tara:strand:- start:41 stop:235 length:195 start_codon:yes stop_codon:yes gene_type:complete